MALVPMTHGLAGFVASWFVMSVAMMLPTVLRPMRRVSQGRSSRMWGFAVGYLMVWVASGVPAFVVMFAIPASPLVVALLWLAVGAWLQVPVVLRSFRSCRTLATEANPLAAGLRQGIQCLIGCWLVMTVAMATVMVMDVGPLVGVLAMLALMCLMMWQKLPGRSEPALRAVATSIIVVAAVVAVLGDLSSGYSHHS